MEAASSVEFDYSVGLKMHAFGVVAGEESEGLVQAVCVPRKRKGKVWKIVNVNLRLDSC